jgi:hypothetical protein
LSGGLSDIGRAHAVVPEELHAADDQRVIGYPNGLEVGIIEGVKCTRAVAGAMEAMMEDDRW